MSRSKLTSMHFKENQICFSSRVVSCRNERMDVVYSLAEARVFDGRSDFFPFRVHESMWNIRECLYLEIEIVEHMCEFGVHPVFHSHSLHAHNPFRLQILWANFNEMQIEIIIIFFIILPGTEFPHTMHCIVGQNATFTVESCSILWNGAH